MIQTMLIKAAPATKSFVALITLKGFGSGVYVHMSVSAPFQGEHFGTEVAFEFWRRMGFAVNIKILWLCKRLRTNNTFKGLCSRV